MGTSSRAGVLSVVLPCYKAAPLARRSVARLHEALDARGEEWEVIVVDDGRGDFAAGDWAADPRVRLLSFPGNRGKAVAVRAGVLAARGNVRVFMDVDLPFGVSLLDVIAGYIRMREFDVVIGDRTLRGASYNAEISRSRRMASAVYSAFVGTVVTGGFFDTQCALTALRGDVADQVFRISRIDRLAFDVELVYLALKHGLDFKRIPTRLEVHDTSSIWLARDATQGFVDTFRIKHHHVRGWYRSERLKSIVARDFAAMDRARDSNAGANEHAFADAPIVSRESKSLGGRPLAATHTDREL